MPVCPEIVRSGGLDITIGEDGVVVGRETACHIVIDDASVSRRHAHIYNDTQGCWVRDLASRNGTQVNGRRIDEKPAMLSSGDRIRIGPEELLLLSGQVTRLADDDRPTPALHGGFAPSASLSTAPITIGRSEANRLTLNDPNVSRFHAVVDRDARGVTLRDLSSRNGTRVNGALVSRMELNAGDQIAIGQFRYSFTGHGLQSVDDGTRLRIEARSVEVTAGKHRLLAPTSLVIEPGEFVAMIGLSGAGKTTLVRALTGSLRPTSGTVFINGEPVERRLTDVGYVPQDDIVHSSLRVEEALKYAAELRLPLDTTLAEVSRAVASVLAELHLTDRASAKVSELSGGERKRVNVAVELISKPGILFLDEPTTGLDPGLEKRTMELLRRLSSGGRPIVTITHSTKHLPLCDKLIVMARGGVLLYVGAPAAALTFFGVEDYDDIYATLRADDGQLSPAAARNEADQRPNQSPTVRTLTRTRGSERQPAVVPQAVILTRRYLTLTVRDRRNLALLIGQAPILALAIVAGFTSSVFLRTGPRVGAPTLLFITAITAIWLGAIASAREIVKERSVFARERAVGVGVRAYLVSKVVVLFFVCAVQVLLLLVVLLALRPLHAASSAYVQVGLLLLVTALGAVAVGLLISSLSRSEDQATSYIPLCLIPQLLFGGAIISLVGKGLAFKLLAGAMLARWTFAGLGSATNLNQSGVIVARYGGIFSHSPITVIAILMIFPATALAAVGARLTLQQR